MACKHLNREGESRSCRGSVTWCAFIMHDFFQGHQRIFLHYFSNSPIYPSNLFRMRFWMNHFIFLRIQYELKAYDSYFFHTINYVGTFNLSSFQKMTVALRMLAYRLTVDFVDKYVKMREITSTVSRKFC